MTVAYSVLLTSVRRPTDPTVTKPMPVPMTDVSPKTSGRMLIVVVAAPPPPPTKLAVVTLKSATPAAAVAPRLGPRSNSVEPAAALANVPTVNARLWLAFAPRVRTLPPGASAKVFMVSVVAAAALPTMPRVPPLSVSVPSAEATDPPSRLLVFVPELSSVRVPPVSTVVEANMLLPVPV